MSKSDFDPDKIDFSRLKFAPQDGVAQFESLARDFLPAILGLDFSTTTITDRSELSNFAGSRDTREQFGLWEMEVIQRIEERYGVRLTDTKVLLVDLFRDIELKRRASTQH